MSGERLELPFGSEFSPSQIDLPELLRIVADNEGKPKAIQAAIKNRFYSEHGQDADPAKAETNRIKLAYNCALGMRNYGILDASGRFTQIGAELYGLRDDDGKLYDALARHLLLNLHGMRLIQCIQDMTVAGETVTLDTLRPALAQRGVDFPSGGKHPSMMRLWLAKAGVIAGRWQVDELRLRAVLGTDSAEFSVLSRFSLLQQAFLRALVNTDRADPQPANEIAKLAAVAYGVRFPEKSLPKLVLDDLVAAGYITAEKTTTGRGSRPFSVAPTEKLKKEILEPLLDQLKGQIEPKLLDLLRKPLSETLDEVKSEDKYVAGLALEALAFKLMRLLDIDYLATRLRGAATGGAEVDLVFESARLVFSRWQVQCKRTDRVSLDDVAKEVGLTHFLKSNAIVIVTTGEVGSEARRYANKIMADSNLAIVMIEGSDLAAIEKEPTFITEVFGREARHAMKLKTLNLES